MSGMDQARRRAWRGGAVLLSAGLAVASMPAARSQPAGEPWQPVQVISTAGPGEGVGLAATTVLDDGSTLAIHEQAGAFWQSRREPGGDWTEPQRIEPPDADINGTGSAAVSPAGTVWLTYSVATQDGDEAHVVRMSADQPETVLVVSSTQSAGSVTVDRDGDLLFTLQGNSREGAWYGDENSTTLTRLAPRTRFFSFQPHSWALGPGDRVARAAFDYDDEQIEVRRVVPGAPRAQVASRWQAPTQGIDYLYADVRIGWRGDGSQVVAWSEPDSRPRYRDVVRLARRAPGATWGPARVVGRSRADSSNPTYELRMSLTDAGAYVAWAQPGQGLDDTRLVGFFVRPGHAPVRQLIAGPRQVGYYASLGGFTVATDAVGRLLVVWDSVPPGSEGYKTRVAEGHVRGELARQLLFTDAQSRGLLRPGGEATVIARVQSPTDPDDEQLLSRSTD